ncbi:leucyl-tRNA synthetase [Cucurbitaria berberidis CBS 394.84]|uniref:leucine--tRNA ligase n=1 Tax=Cucurbitaria berberidis CBS 394.84 TaxID=1168544 RepID=A0A9P4GFL5_9PLEO|nr:leucyl-tRNA synthetase [Cucurbitaria berberidis CBS 394.84]KAF1844727.1 leucyl-tRNA synthetase [Cucurbitaria berberidis CBS 394.84]
MGKDSVQNRRQRIHCMSDCAAVGSRLDRQGSVLRGDLRRRRTIGAKMARLRPKTLPRFAVTCVRTRQATQARANRGLEVGGWSSGWPCLHRVGWRRALRHARIVQPCIASRWTSSSTSRKRSAEEPSIETLTAKWQPHWDKLASQWHQLRKSDKGQAYVLPMFPYPSGTLHLGHLRVYTISDVLARFKHMQGYKVLHPIGWDAFGLPAENAAIERGVHPEKWTLQNIQSMKTQMEEMGGRWDWDSEIRTCDPAFYKHTQRIFLMLHERGLAYQAESLVNYDPVDKTVLANEQVDANGCSWRSGAKVEKVLLKQWFLKIKEFQEPLLKDLDALAKNGRWPEKVLAMQRNWIGKSEGTKVWFNIETTNGDEHFNPVDVFTTRADTLFGVQYIALSLRHPIVQHLAVGDEALRAFLERAKDLPLDNKEGFLLSNLVAKNPITNTQDASIPVYVAPYVLEDYGSGAVMGVPGHDARDHAFWRQNAGCTPIEVVISTKRGMSPSPLIPGDEDKPVTERGFVAAHIDRFGSMSSKQAVDEIVNSIRMSGGSAEKTTSWRLRDWLISRQRYWGTPIPIVHCGSCGPVPVPEKDLPVELPSLPDSFFEGRKGNPLAEDEHWKKTMCPKCGSAAERETDTMDTFMDSSWYFFRFLDPKNESTILDPEKANDGMPVDLYVGGVEHAILHLLYARFISKFLATTAAWPKGNLANGEPFKRLITQGMVHGETFTDPENGRFLRPEEVDLATPSKPIIKTSGLTPNISYEKMSKSKYNGVDPGATIAKYGADVTRAHMLFQAPVSDVLEWDEKKITGVQRWLHRIVRLSGAFFTPSTELETFKVPSQIDITLIEILRELLTKGVLEASQSAPRTSLLSKTDTTLIAALSPDDAKLWTKAQETIASVTESYSQTYSLNTIVSDLMTLTNIIWDTPHSSTATPYLKWYSTVHLIRMVAPIAPGVAEEAWHLLKNPTHSQSADLDPGDSRTVFATGFPIADLDIIPRLNHTRKCVVQVDGKRKFEVDINKLPESTNSKDMMAVSKWVLDQLVETEEGKEWLDMGSGKIWKASQTRHPHPVYKVLPDDWKVIAVNGGALCNFVGPKKPKKAKAENQASIPYTQTCPSPTCECASTPPDLDIDRKAPLLNTMAAYSEQVIICTGKEDWTSNIEQEEGETGAFVKGLKGVIGKGGVGFDPFTNVLITASSLPQTETKNATTALLFPSFKRIKSIPHTSDSFSHFATAYLKAKTLHPMHDGLSKEQKANLTRDESVAAQLPPAESVSKPTILICGHGGRDQRCGVLGPILQASFRKELQRRSIDADVAQISHIGGHKYAGNVIIYVPPSMQDNALRGSGIWYGRIGPENVEGVVDETLVKGRVIAELLRGGVMQNGGNIGRIIEAQLKKERGEEDGDKGLRLKPRART